MRYLSRYLSQSLIVQLPRTGSRTAASIAALAVSKDVVFNLLRTTIEIPLKLSLCLGI
jgi:hypothetical protein